MDADRGAIVDPPELAGWVNVPVREMLAAATGFPVRLEKDTTAAAVGELWTGRGPVDDSFVFIHLGTRIGAAELPEWVDRLSATRSMRRLAVDGTVVGDDVGAVGAACVVLDSVLTLRPKDLMLERQRVQPE